MRKLAFAVASVALLAGTSASAQIGDITYTAGSAYFTPGTIGVEGSGLNVRHVLPEGEGRFPGADIGGTGGAAYNSFVNITDTSVFFESSNATSQGPFTSFQSFSTVSFGFTNAEDGPINFHSEITPQGLGMYLADTSGGCIFSNSCAQVSHHVAELNDLLGPGGATSGFLGGVAFQFDILDNESVIYTLSGSLLIGRNVGACDGYCIIDNLGSGEPEPFGARSLNGFAMQTDPTDGSAIAFGWDATGVDLSLGSGFHQIEYRTSVASFTNADCLLSSICLVAYSGFGDPIGRGGGIDAASAALDGGFDVGALHDLPGGLIQGLNFTPSQFSLRFEDGQLVYDSNGPQGAVPEPGAWALMILGFGTMGAALRRRRIPAHI